MACGASSAGPLFNLELLKTRPPFHQSKKLQAFSFNTHLSSAFSSTCNGHCRAKYAIFPYLTGPRLRFSNRFSVKAQKLTDPFVGFCFYACWIVEVNDVFVCLVRLELRERTCQGTKLSRLFLTQATKNNFLGFL